MSYLLTNQNNFEHIAYNWDGGSGKTVASSGCGPCAALMMLENLTSQRFNMADWIAWVKSTGARVVGGTYMPKLVQKMVERFGFTVTATSSEVSLTRHLQSGGMAIANVGGSRSGWSGLFSSGGHFVAVLGLLNDGRYIIGDPAFTKNRYRSAFRRSKVQVDGNLVYVSASNLHLDTLARTPNYYLFTAPAAKVEREEEDMAVRYETYDAIPEWSKPAVKQLMDTGKLKGDGNGNIDLSYDMLRILVVLHNKTYDTVEECPEYAKATVQRLIDEGALKGDSNGKLGLTLDMLRLLVIDERSLA